MPKKIQKKKEKKRKKAEVFDLPNNRQEYIPPRIEPDEELKEELLDTFIDYNEWGIEDSWSFINNSDD